MPGETRATGGSVAVGGNVSKSNIVVGNHNQTNLAQQEQTQGISAAEVLQLLKELRDLVQASDLPDKDRVAHEIGTALYAAEDESKGKTPDKKRAAESLANAVEILKGSGNLVDSTLELWNKAEPILERIAPWLVAAGLSLGL